MSVVGVRTRLVSHGGRCDLAYHNLQLIETSQGRLGLLDSVPGPYVTGTCRHGELGPKSQQEACPMSRPEHLLHAVVAWID
jgi:hypothetical protein